MNSLVLDGLSRTLAHTTCDLAVDGAGQIVACLSTDGLHVYAIDSGELRYEETFSSKPDAALYGVEGAVALSPDGAYLAYANKKGFAIVELATKKVVARQDLDKSLESPNAITVADGGRMAAILEHVRRAPLGRRQRGARRSAASRFDDHAREHACRARAIRLSSASRSTARSSAMS